MTSPRPDQSSRPNIPLSPGGISVAQIIASGLLTNADMLALGLMLDTTGQAIHTGVVTTSTNTLNTATHTNTTASNTGTALTQGIPPAVQNATSYSSINQNSTGSPYTFGTFGGDSRIWAVHLSLAIYKDSTASGATQGTAFVRTGSGLYLAVTECAIGGSTTQDSDSCDLTFPGLEVSSGDSLILNVNYGTAITNGGIRASCVVIASTP